MISMVRLFIDSAGLVCCNDRSSASFSQHQNRHGLSGSISSVDRSESYPCLFPTLGVEY